MSESWYSDPDHDEHADHDQAVLAREAEEGQHREDQREKHRRHDRAEERRPSSRARPAEHGGDALERVAVAERVPDPRPRHDEEGREGGEQAESTRARAHPRRAHTACRGALVEPDRSRLQAGASRVEPVVERPAPTRRRGT